MAKDNKDQKPKTSKKRTVGVTKLTFLYTEEGSSDLIAAQHTTKQFARAKAWEEWLTTDAAKGVKNPKLVTTFKNHVEVADKRLRKPTRVELEALAMIE
jgi:hypothetical protein